MTHNPKSPQKARQGENQPNDDALEPEADTAPEVARGVKIGGGKAGSGKAGGEATRREDRLAEALRANLRRRKSAAKKSREA